MTAAKRGRLRTTVRPRWLALLGLVGFLALNAMACMHATAMTRWAESGRRTERPEQLGLVRKVGVLLTGVEVPRPENRATPADRGLEYGVVSFANGRGEQLEAWHVPASDSTVLVLLFHGYASAKDSLLPLAAGLHGLGCSTLLVDFYGSGGSSGDSTGLGVSEAHDVVAALNFARATWPDRRLVLYGQSMGGAALLRAIAVHGATPDAVVVESTFSGLLDTTKARFHAMGLPGTPFAQLLLFWGGVVNHIDAFEHRPTEYARSVRCPTLVLHGRRDRRVSTPGARALFEGLGGWKHFGDYPEGGHGGMAETHPAQWRNDVQALLATLGAVS